MLIKTLSKEGYSAKAGKYEAIFARRYPDSAEGRDYIEAMLTSPAPYLEAESGSPAWITRAVLLLACCGVLTGALIVAGKLKRSSRGRPAAG
ncbi:MAG: hypothetical protein JSU94_06085 [Phycisphaerales bacterium]|nr:MAG: hypothetical protein JSU94_06085 [Phycisphaerales bacterium]